MPNGKKNFGDDLGPYIVKELSGKEISYIPLLDKPLRVIKRFLFGLIKHKYNLKDIGAFVNSIFRKNVLVTIGSIIHVHKYGNPIVWGSGIIDKDQEIYPAKFLAVRGVHTQNKLRDHNYYVPEVIGDPALLLPLIHKEQSKKKYKLGIIPHYIHYEELKEKFYNTDVLVVNMLEEIPKVIEDITSCEQTISSSLHGIIVSHAYGIPSLWYKLATKKLAGDNIKFKDYFSSVNIIDYDPFELPSDYNNIINEVLQKFTLNRQESTPNVDIKKLQRGLLEVAPFPIRNEYKELLRIKNDIQ